MFMLLIYVPVYATQTNTQGSWTYAHSLI